MHYFGKRVPGKICTGIGCHWRHAHKKTMVRDAVKIQRFLQLHLKPGRVLNGLAFGKAIGVIRRRQGAKGISIK